MLRREYRGEDPLQPWLDRIKWVQESFPTGGECSGLVAIYEQCVRTFWHHERYKDDLRYLKVWLEYAENCADAEVIFRFLEAKQIVGVRHKEGGTGNVAGRDLQRELLDQGNTVSDPNLLNAV